jgi:hypothetical protein
LCHWLQTSLVLHIHRIVRLRIDHCAEKGM